MAVLAEAAVVPARREDQFETEEEARSAVERPRDPASLQLLAEELSVAKETRETGRVRISTRTHEREALIDEDLARERVEIVTIPIARRIDAVPQVRQEGDTTIIPVVEERLIVDRQLVLKEEIRVRRVRTTERHQEKVALRQQEAVVTRYRPDVTTPDAKQTGSNETKIETVRDNLTENHMAYETIVAVYDTAAHADAAVKALKAAGYANADISVFNADRLASDKKSIAAGLKKAGLWNRLFGDDIHEHEATVYGQSVEHGGVVVSARVLDTEVAHALAILDLHRPVDIHDRAVTSGIAPAAHVEAVEKKLDAVPLAAAQKVALPKVAQANADVLRLAEEQLQVGKRLVDTGRTRVRRFVTERPVSADVTLHEEHADVMRRAITDPKYVGDVDWADKEIEVVETAEQALANKTARIVEEVSLRKIGTDRVETVHDKIRRQQVEIERVGPDGRVNPGQSPRS